MKSRGKHEFLRCFFDSCIRLWKRRRTNGFITLGDLLQHFSDHGSDFTAQSPTEYELLADKFLSGCLQKGTLECIRSPSGVKLRYNTLTEEFGVLGWANNI